jgi:hypothetical protein
VQAPARRTHCADADYDAAVGYSSGEAIVYDAATAAGPLRLLRKLLALAPAMTPACGVRHPQQAAAAQAAERPANQG